MKIFFGFNVYFSMKMLYFPPCFSISLCRNIEWGPGKKSRQKKSPSIVIRCCAKQDGLVLRCLRPCSVWMLIYITLNQSVTLPKGFATVPIENIEDLFLLKILWISFHDKHYGFIPIEHIMNFFPLKTLRISSQKN